VKKKKGEQLTDPDQQVLAERIEGKRKYDSQKRGLDGSNKGGKG